MKGGGIEIYIAPSLSEVSHIIDSIYHNKLILSLSVSCKQLAGLNVVINSFGVVIFWGIKLGDSKIYFLNHFRIPRKVVDLFRHVATCFIDRFGFDDEEFINFPGRDKEINMFTN